MSPIDQHKAAARHRVAPHLDDRPSGRVRSRRNSWSRVFEPAANLRFEHATVPYSPRSAKIMEDTRRKLGRSSRKRIGQIEYLLEVQVPGGEPQLGVKHRDAVAHIVEGDAQLGLALADLVQQPGILHRDNRLCREVLQQRDLLVARTAGPRGGGTIRPEQCDPPCAEARPDMYARRRDLTTRRHGSPAYDQWPSDPQHERALTRNAARRVPYPVRPVAARPPMNSGKACGPRQRAK